MNKWSKKRFWGYAKSVEVKNCRSDWKGTGTQTRKTGNHIGNQIWKPIGIFEENWKPNAYLKQKICELQWAPKLQNLSFLAQKWKNRSKKIATTAKQKSQGPTPVHILMLTLFYISPYLKITKRIDDFENWKNAYLVHVHAVYCVGTLCSRCHYSG